MVVFIYGIFLTKEKAPEGAFSGWICMGVRSEAIPQEFVAIGSSQDNNSFKLSAFCRAVAASVQVFASASRKRRRMVGVLFRMVFTYAFDHIGHALIKCLTFAPLQSTSWAG
jgi:hypothetical protein